MTDAPAIYHADALELSASDFAQFDVQIVDPPYSAHVHEAATSNGTAGAGVVDRDLGFGPLTPELAAVIALGASSVRRWSVIFSDIEGAPLWRDLCSDPYAGLTSVDPAGPWAMAMIDARTYDKIATGPAEYIRAIPWIRWSQPQLSGDRPPSGCELVSIFHRQKIGARGGVRPIAKHWNGPGSLTHFHRRSLRGKEKHPTEKPLDLALDLVSWFSDPGEAVIDPCAGAGTVLLAARLLGRTGAGLESNKAWGAAAQRRVSGAPGPRDRARAEEWIAETRTEAGSVPEPKAPDGSDVKTYERAQRRLADADRVERSLK